MEKVYATPEEVLNQIKLIRNKYSDFEKVVLFGSRARNDARENSDFDLCVFGNDELYHLFKKFVNEVDNIYTHYSFDILFFSHLKNEVLINDILEEGVPV